MRVPFQEARGPWLRPLDETGVRKLGSQLRVHRHFHQARGASTTNTATVRRAPAANTYATTGSDLRRNPRGTTLPVTGQSPEPLQVQAQPVTGSQTTLDIPNMAATYSPFGAARFYLSEMRTVNQPLGPQHHIYSGAQNPLPTLATGNETASTDPAHFVSMYSGYYGSQILQRIMLHHMLPYRPTYEAHEPVHGYEGEEIAGTSFEECRTLVRNSVGWSSVWLSTSGAPSWQSM